MATNLFEALDNCVSCLHCNKTYQAPKRLPCSHIYCKDCLIQIVSKSINPGEFNCPTCQMEVLVASVDDVPDVPALDNFIQALDKIKSLGLDQSPKCTLCTVANSTIEAESFCIDCLSTLCVSCVPKHKYLLKTHNNLLPCGNLEPHHLEKIMKSRTSICTEHEKTMDTFCNTCDELICLHCGSYGHEGHTKQPLNTLGDTVRTRLSDYVQKLHKREDEYEQYSAKADDSKTDYIKQAQATKDQLTEHGEKLIQQIRIFLEESNETIDVETTKICKDIDSLKEILRVEKSRLAYLATYISTMVIYGNQVDVTTTSHDAGFYDTFLHDHKPTHAIPSLDVELQLVEADQFHSNSIGLLYYKVKPGKLESELVTKFETGFAPVDVSCMADGNVVACQYSGSDAAVFAAEGDKSQSLQVPAGTEARGIACTSKYIYLTDCKTHSVLMFNYEGKLMKSIPVGSKGRSGIAITGNQMYVTSQDDHKVYRLTLPDGDNNTVFLQEKDGISKPYGVAASYKRVAVASISNHTVRVFNTAGKLQFQYGKHGTSGSAIGQLKWPYGVALDSSGRVIIVDRGNDQIIILSYKGENLGNINLKQDGLSGPEGICIDNKGHIVVGCDCSPNTIAVYSYSFQ